MWGKEGGGRQGSAETLQGLPEDPDLELTRVLQFRRVYKHVSAAFGVWFFTWGGCCPP